MATIRKRKLSSGTAAWLVDYRDQAGARRYKQFTTKREADAFMVRARAEVAAGTHTPEANSATVAEAAALWLARCQRDKLEVSTIRAYRNHVDLHIVPFIGAMKLARLSAPAVNAYTDELVASGRSLEMARRVRRSLSAIVSHAQSRGLVAANNVLSSSPIKRSKRDDGRPAMPTKAELQRIIAAAPDRHRPMILTAILAGLRGSELRGLTWPDVDLAQAVLRVRRRVDDHGVFGPPKSESGKREIPMAPLLVNALKAWREQCPAGELGLVFPNGAGNVESHGNILRRVFWPIQVMAGVMVRCGGGAGSEISGAPKKVHHDARDGGIDELRPRWTKPLCEEVEAKFSLHALRHAAAALFIEQGFGPKKIQALMGHASIQQTFDRYGYLFASEEDDRKAVAAIAARLVVEGTCYRSATPDPKAEQKQLSIWES